jgi:peroxiredoxin
MDLALPVIGVIVFCLLVVEGWLLVQLLGQNGRLLLRVEALEVRLAAGHRQSAPLALQELPRGSAAPEFALPDLQGRERTLRDFLGQPLLVIFFSPRCGYCAQMAPRLGQLPESGPRVLLISEGDPEEHRRLAAEHGWRCDVLLQKSWEVGIAYGAAGTPTGYLLDSQGRIDSNLASGADALLELVAAAPGGGGSNGHATGLTAETLRAKEQAVTERARAAGLAVRTSQLNRQGLPAGTPAPDFRLPDLAGGQRSLADFRGKRVLLVFSDPNCGPCGVLAPELPRLQREHQSKNLEVVMVSRGDLEANRARAREYGFTFPVLLQKHWEISRAYGMFATPVGYLIDEQGVIAREVAVGADAILGLVRASGVAAVSS